MKASLVKSLVVALSLGSAATLASNPTGTDARAEDYVTRATSGFAAERETDGPRDPAMLEELRLAPHEVVTQAKSQSGVSSSSYYGDAWIYQANVELFDDYDLDGYYTYLRVRFDADSMFNRHYVYAVLMLSADGVFWEDLYITEDFLIRGSSPHDVYEIEVELVSGYPTGSYDLMIELYDADRGVLLDEFGPAHTSAFSLLPLEDVQRDSYVPPVSHSKGRGGGGAASWGLLMLLAGAAVARVGLFAKARAIELARDRISDPSRCRASLPWRTTSAPAPADRIWL